MRGWFVLVWGFVAVLVVAPATLAAVAAVPGADRVAFADDKTKAPEQAKDAGSIDGQVVAIDYRAGTMSVQAGSRKVDVVVLPSTNIQGPGNAFHTIADISRGARVRVLMSQRGTTYTAQLINLH